MSASVSSDSLHSDRIRSWQSQGRVDASVSLRNSWLKKITSTRLSRKHNRSTPTTAANSDMFSSITTRGSSQVLLNILADDNDPPNPKRLDASARSVRSIASARSIASLYNDEEGAMAHTIENLPFYPVPVDSEDVVKNEGRPCWKRCRIVIIVVIVFIALAVVMASIFVPKKSATDQAKSEPMSIEFVENHFSQVLIMKDHHKFNEEEIKVYESQMQSYTAKFGQHEYVISTCSVIKQELLGEGGSSNIPILLVITFTMKYETHTSYGTVSQYPNLFEEYIDGHVDQVTKDMQNISLPVVQVGEAVLLQYAPNYHTHRERTKSPSSRPSMSVKLPAATDVCVTFQGASLIDCGESSHCNPNIGSYENTALISKHDEYIHFLSKGNESENFEVIAEFDATTLATLSVSDIAVSDNNAAIGSARENIHTGTVTMFEKDSTGMWLQSDHIVPGDDIREGAEFGTVVNIDGDTMVVGAPHDGEGGGGSAYIFRRSETGWPQEAKLTEDPNTSTDFGASVSVKGDIIAVGDYLHVIDGIKRGGVFMYRHHGARVTDDSMSNSWARVGDVLVNDDCDGWFGSSVALTNDNGLMIGCPDNGSIYYYVATDTGYLLQQKITASSSGGMQEKLGGKGQLAVESSFMVAGTKSVSNGRVYVFGLVNNVWVEITQIDSSPSSDYFGSQVSLSGNSILIASKSDVYSYTLDECSDGSQSTLLVIEGSAENIPTPIKVQTPLPSNETSIAPEATHQNESVQALPPFTQPFPNSSASNPSPSSQPTAKSVAQPSVHPSMSVSVAPSNHPTPSFPAINDIEPMPSIKPSAPPSFLSPHDKKNPLSSKLENGAPSFGPTVTQMPSQQPSAPKSHLITSEPTRSGPPSEPRSVPASPSMSPEPSLSI